MAMKHIKRQYKSINQALAL